MNNLKSYSNSVVLVLILYYLVVHLGVGRHSQLIYSLPLTEVLSIYRNGRIARVVITVFYGVGMGFIKVSVLALYRNIFPSRFIKVGVMILGVLSVAWAVSLVLVAIFSCNPINGQWDYGVPATCIDLRAWYIGNGVINIVTDIMILSLPIREVSRLLVDKQTRIFLLGIFLTGAFVSIACAVRLYYSTQVDLSDESCQYLFDPQ